MANIIKMLSPTAYHSSCVTKGMTAERIGCRIKFDF